MHPANLAFIIGTSLFLLAGCSSSPTAQMAFEDLNHRYDGKSASQFFQDFGQPTRTEQTDSGTLYHWISLEPASLSQHGPAYMHVSPSGRASFVEPTLDSEPSYCEITIEASKGHIQKLLLLHDAPGHHSASLCAEIFGVTSKAKP